MLFRKTRILQTLLLSALLAPLAACGDSAPEAPAQKAQETAPAPTAAEPELTPAEKAALHIKDLAVTQRILPGGCEGDLSKYPLYSTKITSSAQTSMNDDYVYYSVAGVQEYEPDVFTSVTADCAMHIDTYDMTIDVRDDAGNALQPTPHPEIGADQYDLYCEARYKGGRFMEEWAAENGASASEDLQVGDVLVSEGAFIVSPYAPHEKPADTMRAIGEKRKPPAGTTMEILHKVVAPSNMVTYFVRMPEYNSQGWVNSASFMDWYDTDERFQARIAIRNAAYDSYVAAYARKLVVEHGFHLKEFIRKGGENKEWHQRCIDEKRAGDKIIDDAARAKWNATKITVPNKGS